jgi:bla regulator protein BlaR1
MSGLDWLEILLSAAVQCAVVVAVACRVDRAATDPRTKTRVWTVAFFGQLGLLIAAFALPRWTWLNPWLGLPDALVPPLVGALSVLGWALLVLWSAGVATLSVRWMWQSLQLQRLLRTCPPVPANEMGKLAALATPELLRPQGRAVAFRISPAQLGPFCYQLHRPFVCLPESLLRGESRELQHVLLHELTHLTTQHPVQLFVQRVAQCAFWWLPAAWTAGRRASLAREFVCDDAAIENGASPARYLRILLEFVARPGTLNGAALAVARSRSDLRIRALRLADPARPRHFQRRRARLAPMIVAVAAVLASQIWIPSDPLAPAGPGYSPWPTWSATVLRELGVHAADFGDFHGRQQVHEVLEDIRRGRSAQG